MSELNELHRQRFAQYTWLIQMGLIETMEVLCIFNQISDMEYAISMRDGYEEC